MTEEKNAGRRQFETGICKFTKVMIRLHGIDHGFLFDALTGRNCTIRAARE
jgi:hypothetical protein